MRVKLAVPKIYIHTYFTVIFYARKRYSRFLMQLGLFLHSFILYLQSKATVAFIIHVEPVVNSDHRNSSSLITWYLLIRFLQAQLNH